MGESLVKDPELALHHAEHRQDQPTRERLQRHERVVAVHERDDNLAAEVDRELADLTRAQQLAKGTLQPLALRLDVLLSVTKQLVHAALLQLLLGHLVEQVLVRFGLEGEQRRAAACEEGRGPPDERVHGVGGPL